MKVTYNYSKRWSFEVRHLNGNKDKYYIALKHKPCGTFWRGNKCHDCGNSINKKDYRKIQVLAGLLGYRIEMFNDLIK